MKKFLIVVVLFFSTFSSFAQEKTWAGAGIEANFLLGKMIKHTANFTGVLPKESYGFQLNFVKQTYGQKNWHQRRNFPQIGVNLVYVDYNKPSVYGAVIGICPNIQIPLLKWNKLEWVLNAGMGVGYATKPYERLPHPNLENVALGGHWNNVSPFSTDLKWRISQHLGFQIGANFVHVSNASLEQPNLGINLWGAHIGLRYAPVDNNPKKIFKHLEPLKNRWLISARYSMAFYEKNPADGPMFPVYMGSVFASKRYWSKNKAFAGLDYTYNSGVYVFLKDIEDLQGEEKAASTSVAAFAGNEFLVGKLGIVFQLGVYLKELHNEHHVMYQKIGGNYYFYKSEKGILKEAYATVFLKTHKAVAEYAELGLGISF